MPVCLFAIAANAGAQIITDGSLGVATTVNGYIDSSLGQVRGSNLFHSFSTFNIYTNQVASFSSEPYITNIIARVTGGPSLIDGHLSANANLFLLNPRGVFFGSDANLNVTGSLHVSTADYVRFGSGERFYSNLSNASALSISTPEAFGFLDGLMGSISVDGSSLYGANGRSLSLIAGFLTLTDAEVSVEQGRVNLAAVGSAGEVALVPDSLAVSSATRGPITLQHSLINPYEETGTSIYIRAGEFVLGDSSALLATTTHAGQRATIDVDVNRVQLSDSGILSSALGAATGPNIAVRADQMLINGGAAIVALTDSSGVGGNVTLNAREVTMSGGLSLLGTGSVGGTGGAGNLTIDARVIDIQSGALSAVTGGPGDAGNITISADRVTLRHDAAMTSGTTGGGDGGAIDITARELLLEGDATTRPVISATTNALVNGGNAGDIRVDVDTLTMRNGHITSSTTGSGGGGTIAIDATTTSLAQGATVSSETGIVGSLGPATSYGRGGAVTITADSLDVSSGARISASTFANGDGGSLAIDADRVAIRGASTSLTASTGSPQRTNASGAGGSLVIDADNLELQDHASISTAAFGPGRAGRIELLGRTALVANGASITASSFGQDANAGAANDIVIFVDELSVAQGAQISNATHGVGAAGRLLIDNDAVRLESGGLLQVSSLSSRATAGGVGDLFIETNRLSLDGGSIQARSAGGATPGSISIRAQTAMLDNASVISTISTGSANAGDIGLYGSETIDIRGFSQITTEALGASGGNVGLVSDGLLTMQDGFVSTSVLGGTADGGNVLLHATLALLDDSAITARAISGNGGRIDIATTFLLRSSTALLDASSTLGIDGEIGLFGFDVDLNADIAPLPADFLNAQRWLVQPCSSRAGTDVSRLVLGGRDGAYRGPGDFAASPLTFDAERISGNLGASMPAWQATPLLALTTGEPCR